MMTDYQSLGVRPLINAYATVTKYGGSIMPAEVVQAMNAAAAAFVDLTELQRKVGDRIADLTGSEAAYVTSGAAGGVMLSAAACVIHHHPEHSHSFPQIAALKNEAVVQRSHRNGYDFGIQQVGMKFVEIDSSHAALRQAISAKTACIFWFQGAMNRPDEIPLADVIDIADQANIPVIVDAAAQLPPADNLWRFTEMGADMALFSGGKDLRGPQSTGLILGRRDLIESIRRISSPNHGLGRALKVSKEELMGVLTALERYLKLDHAARARYCETTVQLFCDALNQLEGVSAERAFPNEAGQPLPWCRVTIDVGQFGFTCDDLVQTLLDSDPAIAVSPHSQSQFHLNPMTLNPGEEEIVLDACLALLRR